MGRQTTNSGRAIKYIAWFQGIGPTIRRLHGWTDEQFTSSFNVLIYRISTPRPKFIFRRAFKSLYTINVEDENIEDYYEFLNLPPK